MAKIKISKIGDSFIELSYNDFSAHFDKSYQVFHKSKVDILFNADKTQLTVSFTGSHIIITEQLLNYIDTTATSLTEFYNEIKLLL
jgi:hypothetical protein